MTAQLTLLERPQTTMPLVVALQQVADQWSQRLGTPLRVVVAEWAGHRIERA